MKKILLSLSGIVLALWFIEVGRVALAVREQAHRDEARPAAAIVVLGAAEYKGKPSPVLKARLDHALALYRRGLAPVIVTTGGSGGEPVHTEAEVGREYLAARGVPIEQIYIERAGASTAQSIAASAEILKRLGAETCLLVSDGYHLYRAKRMMRTHGIACAASPRPTRGMPALEAAWTYTRQAVGYTLYDFGLRF